MSYVKKHSKKDYLYAKAVQACMSKQERTSLSKKLYGFMKKTLLFEKNLEVNSFWVVKKTLDKWHKGDKIFKYSEMKDYMYKGGKVRDILYHDIEARNELKLLSNLLNVPYGDTQHGFAKERGVLTAVERQEKAKLEPNLFHKVRAELQIDLANAYEQITENQVCAVFNIAFDLNISDARRLAKVMCVNGHLFQGNPVAPVIFNFCTRRIIKIITRNVPNIMITQYADDFSIVFMDRSRVPKRLVKWIVKLFSFTTFELNIEKLRQTNSGSNQKVEWLGVARLKDKLGRVYIQANHRRKMLKKAKWFLKMLEKGYFISTKHKTKKGQFIRVQEMIKGLCSWLIGINKLNKNLFSLDTLSSSVYQIMSRLSNILSEKWYKETNEKLIEQEMYLKLDGRLDNGYNESVLI